MTLPKIENPDPECANGNWNTGQGWGVGGDCWSRGSPGYMGPIKEESWTHNKTCSWGNAPWTRLHPQVGDSSWVQERISAKFLASLSPATSRISIYLESLIIQSRWLFRCIISSGWKCCVDAVMYKIKMYRFFFAFHWLKDSSKRQYYITYQPLCIMTNLSPSFPVENEIK